METQTKQTRVLEYTLDWYKVYYENPTETKSLTKQQITTYLNQ